MRKILVVLWIFTLCSTAHADTLTVSFLKEDDFAGIDNPNGFSSDATVNNLGESSLSLFSGKASVQGYATITGETGLQPGQLAQSGTTGLGVTGGSSDGLIDWTRTDPENTNAQFEAVSVGFLDKDAYLLKSVEVRQSSGFLPYATIDYIRILPDFDAVRTGATVVYTLAHPEVFNYGSNILFQGGTEQADISGSGFLPQSFSLARLTFVSRADLPGGGGNPTVTPEPSAMSLFVLGFGVLAAKLRRRRA